MDLIVDFPRASFHDDEAPVPSRKRVCFQRRVSFEDYTEITIVENLTHNHKDDLWYSHHEMKSFPSEAAKELQILRAHQMTLAQYAHQNADETSAFLGLEKYFTDTLHQKIKDKRRVVRRAVFLEQQRQLRADIYDPDEMANVAMAASDWSWKRARIIALIHHNSDER